ncbi:lysosomal cobalamin transporter ABCD4 [Anabrus simplex]|uniref:lysosomal cobalamin transporter ABCD4 n=1 Tax=Anabrus simplex TaxID=316456 RepID=UPI0035A26791
MAEGIKDELQNPETEVLGLIKSGAKTEDVLSSCDPVLEKDNYVVIVSGTNDIAANEEQFLIYSVGLIPSKFYDILGNKKFEFFHKELMASILYALAIAVVKGIRWFVQQQLYISCRRLLCGHLHQIYFIRNNFYHMSESSGKFNNQMEVVNQDIIALCSQYSDLVTAVMILPFVIGAYIYLVYLNLGWFGPVSAVAFVTISKFLTKAVSPLVVNYTVEHEEKEESFRQFHLRIQASAEVLAFYDAGQLELLRANHRLMRVMNTQEKLYRRQLILNLVINSFDYLGSIMSYVILFIPVYFSWYDYMDSVQISVLISQNAFLFIYLVSVINSFLLVWEKMACFAVNCYHVNEFLMKLEATNSQRSHPHEYSRVIQPGWLLENVTIIAPESGHVILQDLNLQILPGENMLIVGAKSTGKTSILRVLRGLWQPSSGHIECTVSSSDVFFLPQVPVFTSGSLKDQITYPEKRSRGVDEDSLLLELLHLADLESLLFHTADLETHVLWDWNVFLSQRQQQALCFIRALYHRPKFLVTDEATDSLLPSVEDALLHHCSGLGITLIMTTVTSDRLSQYHHKVLLLEGDGAWTLQEND